MKIFVSIFSIVLFTSIVCSAQSYQYGAHNTEDGISITLNGELFTTYKTGKDLKYPYFYPVNGPKSGESVTTESTEPYPHHHSLFFGCDKVNGGNYWQEGLERGQIVSQTVKNIKATGSYVEFSNECLWVREDAPSPFKDERVIRISAPSEDIRYIDFFIRLTALEDVRINKSNHALFSARVVPELSGKEGGTLVNAEGDSGEKATFGKKSAWMDYWGTRQDGTKEGIAIMDHPGNRWHPSTWFTRDYGFFSPTPMNWLENGFIEFKKDETLELKYRVVVHAGDTKSADINIHYKDWVK